MKKYILFSLLFAVATISLSSCYDLERIPGDQLSSATTFRNKNGCDMGMMGVYAVMHNENCLGKKYFDDAQGGWCWMYDQQEGLQKGTWTATTGNVLNRWTYLYEGVARANNVIQNITANADILAQNNMPQNLQTQYIAEAKFLRSLFYFYLVDYFGDVPYYDESVIISNSYNDMKEPRTEASTVYSNIIKDLDEGIANLPKAWDDANLGRATAGAAEALKGKVYFYQKDYNTAATCFKNVINNYGYELYPNYADLFTPTADNSSEMIFSIQNMGGTAYTGVGMPIAHMLGTNTTYSNCWNNMMIACSTIDMYECKDGHPFDWKEVFPDYPSEDEVRNAFAQYGSTTAEGFLNFIKPRTDVWWCKVDGDGVITYENETAKAKVLEMYENRDPRMKAVAILPWTDYTGYYGSSDDPVKYYIFENDTKYGVALKGILRPNNNDSHYYPFRKFVPESVMDGLARDRATTPINFPLIRLADVFLMLAECDAQTGNINEAVEYINKVRARVGMPGINSGPAFLSATTKEEVMERIKRERRFELIGEGHAYSDVRRWGELEKLNGWRDFTITGYRTRYARVSETRNYLWPIPGTEIDKNPKLTQNPGW